MNEIVRELPYTKTGVKMRQLHVPIVALDDTVYSGLAYDGLGALRVACFSEDTTHDAQVGNLVTGHNTLTVEADKSTITADETDEATITSSPLTSFDYKIWLAGQVVASGSVTDSEVEISTNTAGLYLIEIIDGNNSGYAEVTAEEPA